MMMDFDSIEEKIRSGTLHQELERELTDGFRQLHASGEPLPPASHYAARIAEIIARQTTDLSREDAFDLYQEVLLACENARKNVLGEDVKPS